MRAAISLAVVGLVAAALLFTRSSARAQDAEPAPIVLVVDGTGTRLSVVHLRRELEVVLSRGVVLVADERAAALTATLTIAYVRPQHWIVRFTDGDRSTTRELDVRGPALEAILGLALATVAPTGASEPTVPAVAVATLDDPFAGPPVSRITTVALRGSLVDPFTTVGGILHVLGTPDVVDPWTD